MCVPCIYMCKCIDKLLSSLFSLDVWFGDVPVLVLYVYFLMVTVYVYFLMVTVISVSVSVSMFLRIRIRIRIRTRTHFLFQFILYCMAIYLILSFYAMCNVTNDNDRCDK